MRTTLASALVVACALVIGGLAFVVLLRSSLVANVQDEAQQRAATAASEISSGSKPQQVAAPGDEDFLLQVIEDRTGALLATSDPKLTRAIRSVHPGESTTIDHIPIGDANHSFRIVAKDAQTPDGKVRIVVGGSLEHVAESVSAVRRMLLLGVPGVLMVVILTTWLFTGRALRPVEEIRREVAEISARDLNKRVRVPKGTDEIARLALTMNGMLSRLADSQQRQRRFISDASHELRSPLTTIRHHAEVALNHPKSTDLQEMAATLLAEESRLECLVDDLLILARADEHTLALARGPIDLDDLVFEEAARLRATSNLRVDTSKVSAARIEGESSSLRRALRNVVDNAARHAHTRVGFEVTADTGMATVAVADDGAGIPEEDRGRIFERFTRLETARDRDSGGSGLGLAIVSEIMIAHGGSVTVSDGSEVGARFEMSIPAREAAASSETLHGEDVSAPPGSWGLSSLGVRDGSRAQQPQ